MTGQEKSDLLIQVTALAGLTVYDNPYDTIKIIYKNGYNMLNHPERSPHSKLFIQINFFF
jgi:hypothetical protein